MQLELRILRFDPERDQKAHEESYRVEADPMDRVLDLLHRVKYEQDGTLTFRRSCAHGVCGSDAMLINGRNRLACKIRVNQLSARRISVAPLPGLPVMKDLVVDMEAFFTKFRSVKPYLQADTPEPELERRQSPADRAVFDDTTKCILCACCSTSCPSFWWNPDKFVGPAGLLQAYRFIADSRDTAANQRLDDLEDPYRLFRCHTIMNCTDVCPKDLNPARAIAEIKKMLLERHS